MLARVNSSTVWGIEAIPITIDIDSAKGMPQTIIVGLPDASVKESKERVRSAIVNSNIEFPKGRLTISLAPADIKKEGALFDLPIALGICASSGLFDPALLERFVIVGELSLDGRVRPVKGALAIASALDEGASLILPYENAAEAALIDKVNVFPARDLLEAVAIVRGGGEISPYRANIDGLLASENEYDVDMADVKGQMFAKRAIEVAVAGGHNIIMVGPPGSGKTMLAKRVPTIMPELDIQDAIETTKIYSVGGMLNGRALITTPPFRSPHHTSSAAAIIGGGNPPSPGEITFAHNGVLFLDEFPEFRRDVIEALREPMEEGRVNISRAGANISFPARFFLICAMNPCPCGYFNSRTRQCRCSPFDIKRYLRKVSGPIWDRIDIQLEVVESDINDTFCDREEETSDTIRRRVIEARQRQKERFKGANISRNGQMSARQVKRYCRLSDESISILKNALVTLGLSLRSYHKVIKVARTVADLNGHNDIETQDILEALNYRRTLTP